MQQAIITPRRAGARGYWQFDAQAPLEVSDPQKFRALLGLPPRPYTHRGRRLDSGSVPYSIVRHVAGKNPIIRRELEPLLSGGRLLWRDQRVNLVVNEGLTNILDVYFSAATQDTTWFIGLTDGTPTPAAGDTLASHAGWVEVTAYDETNRVAFVDAGAAAQSISNTASPAVFTISANSTTVGGGFIAGVNTGTAGIIYAVAAFTAGDKVLDDGDTLSVTATFTMAAA